MRNHVGWRLFFDGAELDSFETIGVDGNIGMRDGLIGVVAYTLLEGCVTIAEGFLRLWGDEVDRCWWSLVRVDVDEIIDVDGGRRGISFVTAALMEMTAVDLGHAASWDELGC